MAFHDLTKGGVVPPLVKSLLGLSLKFCVPSKYTNFDLKPSLDRFNRDLHLKTYFAGSENEELPAAKFYAKSEWNPPDKAIPREIHDRLKNFNEAIGSTFV